MNHDEFTQGCEVAIRPLLQAIQKNQLRVVYDEDNTAYTVTAQPTIVKCIAPPLTTPPGPYLEKLLMVDKAGIPHVMEMTAQEGIDKWGDEYQLVRLNMALQVSAGGTVQNTTVAVLLKNFNMLTMPEKETSPESAKGWDFTTAIIEAIRANGKQVWDDSTAAQYPVDAVATHGRDVVALFKNRIFTLNELYLDLNGLPRRVAGAKGHYFNTKVRSLEEEIASFNANKNATPVVIIAEQKPASATASAASSTNRW